MVSNPFLDWTKSFSEFKAPNFDMTQVMSQYRRNAETGSTVIQLATESAQAIARRQAEILRSNAEQALKASKEMFNNNSPEAAAAKQADFAKSWLDYNVNSMRELMEMGTKSAQETFDIINKRMAEQVKEFTDVATSQMKKKAA